MDFSLYDNKLVASAGWDGRILVWDFDQLQPIITWSIRQIYSLNMTYIIFDYKTINQVSVGMDIIKQTDVFVLLQVPHSFYRLLEEEYLYRSRQVE